MIEKMDESIGKIVAELDRLGLKDNTLVLFTSDNGGMRHVSAQAVPLWQGLQPVPKQSDGISILPTLLGKGQQKQHPYLYHEFIQARAKLPYTARSVRSGPWKAVQVAKDGTLQPIELYNLEDDLARPRTWPTPFPKSS